MSRPHPHDTDNLRKLLMKVYSLGWYTGIHDLCTIRMEGGFEHNLSCRGSEDWDVIFYVKTKEIRGDGGSIIFPAVEDRAETLDVAIGKVLNKIEIFYREREENESL